MNSRLESKTLHCKEAAVENEFCNEASGAKLSIANILDALPCYALIVDSDPRIILTNKAMQTRLGNKTDEVIG